MSIENICKFNPTASSDLICTNFVCEVSHTHFESKCADANRVSLVTDGDGEVWVDGKTFPLEKGTVFVVKKGEAFSISGDEAFKYYYISFHGRRSAEYIERIHISEKRCFYGYEELVPFWHDCLDMANDGNIDMLSEAVLLYTFARLMPQKSEQSDVITRIVIMTNDSFSDPELSLSAISDKIGYNSKYISALFKKQKGITYGEYLRDLRIKHALFLIEQGVGSVKNVAFLSGFNDPLYFSKVFSEYVGVSPKQYIQKSEQK